MVSKLINIKLEKHILETGLCNSPYGQKSFIGRLPVLGQITGRESLCCESKGKGDLFFKAVKKNLLSVRLEFFLVFFKNKEFLYLKNMATMEMHFSDVGELIDRCLCCSYRSISTDGPRPISPACSQVGSCAGIPRKQESSGGQLWLGDSPGWAKAFLGLCCSLSLLSPLSFPRCQMRFVVPRLSLPTPASSLLCFTQVFA